MLRLKKSQDIKYNPSLQPEVIFLTKETTSFGRSAELVDVVVDSSCSPRMISRVHAKISQNDNHFFIECGSLNGVLVNSVKRSKCELHDGDLVVFGGAGANTCEGTLVTKNSQSELVYIFRTPQKCSKSQRKIDSTNTEITKQKNISYTNSKKIAENICKDTDDDVQRTTCSTKNTTKQFCSRTNMDNIQYAHMLEDSPGEGTSDGLVKKNKDVAVNCIDDDAAASSEDDKKGFVFQRKKKKRRRLPFDSDEDW